MLSSGHWKRPSSFFQTSKIPLEALLNIFSNNLCRLGPRKSRQVGSNCLESFQSSPAEARERRDSWTTSVPGPILNVENFEPKAGSLFWVPKTRFISCKQHSMRLHYCLRPVLYAQGFVPNLHDSIFFGTCKARFKRSRFFLELSKIPFQKRTGLFASGCAPIFFTLRRPHNGRWTDHHKRSLRSSMKHSRHASST